ncbi:MAG: GNAT family N-acetyltransferase [bacterium]|nr:GNAT family N-acetyltransferase [bacterium]
MSAIVVTPAKESDLTVVLEILDEAARWLIAQGIRQWESPPPPEARTLFTEAITKSEAYLLRQTGDTKVIGTFRLCWDHAPFWPDRKPAGYLYTLALRPEFIGQGFGKMAIDWVAEQIRARELRWLRLDCIATNMRLRRWYEALGFTYRGTRSVGGYELALYEREDG